MAADFSNTGAFNVNGQFATRLRYEARVDDGRVVDVQVHFANGRSEIARAHLAAEDARALLGEKNFGAIEQAAQKAAPPAPDNAPEPVKGVLQGRTLDYRQVMLPEYQAAATENAIHLDSRVRAPAPGSARPNAGSRLAAGDAAVGAAHVTQAAGVGAADATQVARDAAAGPPVRALDAATAAASAALGTATGGAAVQGAAKAIQALGSADTAARALRMAEDLATPLHGARAAPGPDAETDEQARLRRLRAQAVPQAVAERFLRVEDQYYFPDKTLAFTDRGTKLKAETHHLEVVRSLVAIAEARDWQALSVTGTQDFRREVWREASLRGLDVRGYEPSALEREALRAEALRRHGPNEVAQARPPRAPVEPHHASTPAAAGPDTAATAASPRKPGAATRAPSAPDGIRAGVAVGVLVEHGAAPYKFDRDNDASYYVKLQGEHGEQTLWGVDLRRALAESKTAPRPGDVVGVENLGNRPVTVTARRRDADGREVAEEITTHRNTWAVEKKAYFQDQAARADAIRYSEPAARAALVAQHPDLVDAAVSLWLGEQVAQQKIERREDQARFVAAVRERLAQAIEQGESIQAPKLRQEVAARLDADRTARHPPPRAAAASAEHAAVAQPPAHPADRAFQPPRARTPEVPQHAR